MSLMVFCYGSCGPEGNRKTTVVRFAAHPLLDPIMKSLRLLSILFALCLALPAFAEQIVVFRVGMLTFLASMPWA